jgi:mycofactocin precursor
MEDPMTEKTLEADLATLAAQEQAAEHAAAAAGEPDDALVIEDLLVEEVSIDGMCGVY